jgi:DNA-binding HxlR family transcriptional regulator
MPQPADALSEALAVVGDRWSLLVVDALIDAPKRFAELEASIGGIATNVLSQRLKRLEAAGVLMAAPYNRRPVRYSYSLTSSGRDLAGAMRLLAQWSADHHGGVAHPPVHPACGTALAARWWCPTCDQPAEPDANEITWV